MKITVNLATRPFIELRPIFLRLRIFMGVLAFVAVGALVASHILQRKLDVAQAQINAVHAKVVAAQDEKRRNEQRMREPQNAAVLARAHFLNALFLRKSFSWTAVMMDLENVLPTGVQVTAIEPQITTEGDVIIRLRVSGDRDRAIQLVRNLERTSRFIAPRLSAENAHKTETGSIAAANAAAPGDVEFDILANYNPLPDTPAVEKSDRTAAAKTAAAKPHVKRAAKPGPHDGVVLPPFSPRPAAAKPAGGAR